MKNKEKLLKVTEAAKLLCISKHTVRNYVNKGIINGSKLGNIYLIPESEIEKFFPKNKND